MSFCHHYHHVNQRFRGTSHASPHVHHTELTPAQILGAYGFRQNEYQGLPTIKLGIGSLGGGVVQQDIDNSVAQWGMAPPNLQVRTVQGAANDPSDHGSNVENMLDIVPTMAFTWWWLTGMPADITICFGPNPGGMLGVTQDLVHAGCKVVSWSWGKPADRYGAQERADLQNAFSNGVAAGCTFVAASGDNSIDDGEAAPTPDYPCSDPNVWAVGGTKLLLNTNGSIRREKAWGDGRPGDNGGGGGIDLSVPMPLFQHGIVPGSHRGVPDSSANADPTSGWIMSANGLWTAVGGTSAAAPFTAALIAIAKSKHQIQDGLLTNRMYQSRQMALNDILLGSNGERAHAGWDEATGIGSPKGASFIDSLK